MLGDLPQELLLTILSHLRVEDIVKLRCISKAWEQFIAQNQFTVFRAAAILEFNIPPWAKRLQDLQGIYSPRTLAWISTWKELCVRLIQIKKSWKGTAPSTITSHQYLGASGVHRFKIDEQAGLIITTASNGGLFVMDLNWFKWYHDSDWTSDTFEDSGILWELPDDSVPPFAHCEYDHGYLIFDGPGGDMEVWRLVDYDEYYSSQSTSSETSSSFPTAIAEAMPDKYQTLHSEHSGRLWNNSRSGQFTPWVMLHVPAHAIGFRFIYPTLLVIAYTTAYLYDVRTGKLVQELGDLQDAQPDFSVSQAHVTLGNITYVDHSPQHLFICGEDALRVFSRVTGRCVYEIPSTFGNYGRLRWKIGGHRNRKSRTLKYTGGPIDGYPSKAWDNAGSTLYQHIVVKEKDRPTPLSDLIVAAHVSSCGKYLAVLFETSRLLVIRDLDRLFKGEISLLDCTIQVQLGRAARFSQYLVFEHGRIGAATRNGVFIVIPHSSFFSSAPLSSSSPPPSVLRVHVLNDPLALDNITCLQMTQTGLFVNWFPQCPLTWPSPLLSENHRKKIHTEREDVFWRGLEEPLEVTQWMDGSVSIIEDGEMMEELGDSVVLSVDFVPT